MRMNARLMFSASPKPTVIARHNWTSESELDGKATTTKIKVMQVWLKAGGGREVLLRRALDRTCCSRPVTYRGSGQEGHPN